MTARVGVITFPGSLDDRDAQRAIRVAGGEPVALWHGSHDLDGVDALVLPGGFSYGDYLRAGAIAALAPIMAEVKDAAAKGAVAAILDNLPGDLPGDFPFIQVEDSLAALQRLARHDLLPDVVRLSDEDETRANLLMASGAGARALRGTLRVVIGGAIALAATFAIG